MLHMYRFHTKFFKNTSNKVSAASINSKIYLYLNFFWVNWFGWHRTLFVIFQMDINGRITGGGEIHSLECLASQIWKEAFKDARLRDFKLGQTKLPGNLRQRSKV